MQNKQILYARSCFSFILFLLLMIILGIPLLVILLLTPRAYIQKNLLIYWLLALLFRGFIYASFIPVKITKKRDSYPYPALYVANHQSAADIALLGYVQGIHPHFWFYWDRFSKTPLFSIFTTRLGLGITQNNPGHDARTLLRGIGLMRDMRCNAIIFPEGGRFNDDKIHQFECGFALLARKAAVPVIPVYLHNSGNAYPPQSFLIHTGYPVTVYIGEPMNIAQDESDQDFCDRVHRWFDKYTAK
ncbi:MAG: 1-acyl-sn-glycerol-3-phosphate acyltransferase [Candidatus Babeliaceae bacterium]|nr:1-acyl-sn-glycerol-3-phosphate acyltransferase [Candidatus Babeliaceae bacterium]